jgi:hypothetical protein
MGPVPHFQSALRPPRQTFTAAAAAAETVFVAGVSHWNSLRRKENHNDRRHSASCSPFPLSVSNLSILQHIYAISCLN